MIGIIRLKYGAGSCILPNKQVVWHYLVFIIRSGSMRLWTEAHIRELVRIVWKEWHRRARVD